MNFSVAFRALCILSLFCVRPFVIQAQVPVIFDTDYGAFIDDIFALGLLVNCGDLLDLKMVVSTSEDPVRSGKCVSKYLELANRSDIPVVVGSTFPPYEERGSVCAVPGWIGFALEDECGDYDFPSSNSTDAVSGLDAMAQLIVDSGRDDWWYILVGGQTSFRDFLEDFPEAAAKIDTLIVMAGNWCAGFEPYPGVMAPTDETNIGCDPAAANDVLDGTLNPIRNIYYVPVVVADEIAGEDYAKVVEAADSGSDPGAAATIDFYRAWSTAARADDTLLIHLEAMTYDPDTESTPMFDPCAIMLAVELLNGCEDRLAIFDFDAVHFLEAGEGVDFPDSPRSAFSLHTGVDHELPEQCPALTNHTFEVDTTVEEELAVKIPLGFISSEAKASFYAEMALRMAGQTIALCEEDESSALSNHFTAAIVGICITVFVGLQIV